MITAYLPIRSDTYSRLEQSILAASPVVQILVICIIGPIAEELLFRGIIYRRLRDYTGTAWAAVLSGILFGVIHGNLTQGVYAGIFGVVLALVYEHYGTLWTVITAHIINNLMASFGDPVLAMLSVAGQYVYTGVMILCVCVFGWYIFAKHRKVNRA
ncbi:MAG: CPBP family intramembrane metalloprotease [Lachnospiraceae bacterium]|nr:CPBP family intramembrane metalloprotease [Lachnospiraceae bacterium]